MVSPEKALAGVGIHDDLGPGFPEDAREGSGNTKVPLLLLGFLGLQKTPGCPMDMELLLQPDAISVLTALQM